MPYTLDDLPYPADALEPHVGQEWVRVQRHWHEGYVTRLNSLLAGTGSEDVPVDELLRRLHDLPDELHEPVRESGGGHLNHSLLWMSLSPDGGGEPGYELLDDIEQAFGSFHDLEGAFRAAAEQHAGQGWVWLVWHGKALELSSGDLEHNPIEHHRVPLLGIDLWEHAFEGFPGRAAYVDAILRVVDWRVVGERFLEAEERSRELGELS